MSPRVHVILNPVAGGGRAGRLRPELLSGIADRFGADYSLTVTRHSGEATSSSEHAIAAGAKLIIAIGGDGTINETVNGFFRTEALYDASCQLGIVDCGTGSGLAQSLGLPSSIKNQLDLIVQQQSADIDLGRLILRDQDGKRVERLFVSECQVGIGAAALRDLPSGRKRFGAKVAYGSVAIQKTIFHQAQPVTIQLGNTQSPAQPLLGLVIGNGAYCAGGMKLTPGARIDDGQFDVLSIHDMSILSRLWHFTRVYSGTHVRSSFFSIRRSRSIDITSANPLPVSADGELLGLTPCHVELLPAALRVRCDLSNGK